LGSAYDFNTPVDSGSAAALNGNTSANRLTGIGDTYVPANPIANNQVFYLRWADVDNSSADNAVALDDLVISFTVSNAPPSATVADFDADVTSGLAPLTVNFTT
jgi:PKD repeat protein